MGNVVPLKRSPEYLLRRALEHRMSRRYEEAMALLWRAKEQYGLQEDIELELAKTYDEMGCEEEAARSYLRVVRLGGRHRAFALFSLALESFQQQDIQRAVSYFEHFLQEGDGSVPPEAASFLERQIRMNLEHPAPRSQRGRVIELERRAVQRIQAGKIHAAIRTLRHAVTLAPKAHAYTLLASCYLSQRNIETAMICAREAHRRAPQLAQPLCVMAELHRSDGDAEAARRALYLAALRAKEVRDLLNTASESAKLGEDHLTLLLTGRALRRKLYDVQAMMIRSCALLNLGRAEEAGRLLGHLCVLKPEDTVAQAIYRLARQEQEDMASGQTCAPRERLIMGTDVPSAEAVRRVSRLVSVLFTNEEQLRGDEQKGRELCRIAEWALRSRMAGKYGDALAVIAMSNLGTEEARNVLLDAMTDAQIADSLKWAILRTLEKMGEAEHCEMDVRGRFCSLAAGGVVSRPVGAYASEVVQRVSDALCARFPDAAETVLAMWIPYVEKYETPKRERRANAAAAALETLYHRQKGMTLDEKAAARRWRVSPRLCRLYMKRICRAMAEKEAKKETTKRS